MRVSRGGIPSLLEPGTQAGQFLLGDLPGGRRPNERRGVAGLVEFRHRALPHATDDIINAALHDCELVAENRREIRHFARAGVVCGIQRRGIEFAGPQIFPGGPWKANEQAGGLPNTIQDSLWPHQVKHAPLLHAPLQLLGERIDVDARRRRLHSAQCGNGLFDTRFVSFQRVGDLIGKAAEQIGAAGMHAALFRFGSRRLQRRQCGSQRLKILRRRRNVSRIVARYRKDSQGRVGVGADLWSGRYARTFDPTEKLISIVFRRRGILTFIHRVQAGKRIARRQAVVGEQFRHLVLFRRDEKQHRAGPAKDAIGFGVMHGLIAIKVWRIDEHDMRRDLTIPDRDNKCSALSAGGQVLWSSRRMLDPEPIIRNVLRPSRHRDGAAGESSAK